MVVSPVASCRIHLHSAAKSAAAGTLSPGAEGKDTDDWYQEEQELESARSTIGRDPEDSLDEVHVRSRLEAFGSSSWGRRLCCSILGRLWSEHHPQC
jgi:hypothetical protein